MLKKNQATKLKYKKAVDKTAKQFFPPNLTPGVRENITYNPIGPTKLLKSIWLDNSNPWSDMTSVSSRFVPWSFSSQWKKLLRSEPEICLIDVFFYPITELNYSLFLERKDHGTKWP